MAWEGDLAGPLEVGSTSTTWRMGPQDLQVVRMGPPFIAAMEEPAISKGSHVAPVTLGTKKPTGYEQKPLTWTRHGKFPPPASQDAITTHKENDMCLSFFVGDAQAKPASCHKPWHPGKDGGNYI